MMENNYFFIKKYKSKHRAKEGCSGNPYIIARNEELTKTEENLKGASNAIFNMRKMDLEES